MVVVETWASWRAPPHRVLELKTLQGQLERLGLALAEIEARLSRLSLEELHQLASRAEEMRAR